MTFGVQLRRNKKRANNGDKTDRIEMKTAATETEKTRRLPTNKSKMVMTPEARNMIRFAYSILMRVLESGKHPETELTRVISVEEVINFLPHVLNIFAKQPTLVDINPPISICGDIHGQFSDLLRLFDKNGFPHRANYLFLGDYVDRGKHCLETILLLFSYKVIFPNHFFLLRGNHECALINKQYGFYDECLRRYKNVAVYDKFQDVFSQMPITALVGRRILCMHGGISPKLKYIKDIRVVHRPFRNPGPNSIESDILWSDPTNFSKKWTPNTRGVSYMFGADVLRKFLASRKLDLVVRAHQVVQDGYEFFGGRRLVTIFSAPFYCGQFNNAAAVMHVNRNLVCSFVVLRPKKKIARRRMLPAAK